MANLKSAWENKRSIVILSGVLIVLVIVLLGVLIFRATTSRDDTGAGGNADTTPQTTQIANATASTVAAKETTPTPTRVNAGSGGTSATEEAEETEEAEAATSTPKPTATKVSTPTPEPTEMPEEPEIVNLVRNGAFEWGFADDGAGLQWESFTNGGAKYIFAPEAWPLAIRNGDYAQRITVYEAHQSDRYAGIYQTVPAIPGEAYKLTLHGQIRTGQGDIAKSDYGYRMQYAIDWRGGKDWETIPNEEWIELPWDEQLLDGENVEFLDYSTTLTPPSDRLTLFIRTWNKWADPVEAQYTLDTLSLVGPKPADAMFDQPLPDTGGSAGIDLPNDPIFWGSLFLLLFLVGGAIWQRKYKSSR